MTEPLREIQARLVYELSASEGELHLAGRAEPHDLLVAAIADLEDGLELGPDGRLRFGARGSSLSAAAIERHLTTKRLGRPVEVYDVVTSTNDFVLERASQGAEAGLAVLGEHQTAGRGRRGRSFDSRPGLGIWSTTLLPELDDRSAAPRLSLLVAVAVARAIEECTGKRPGLKWPNDVRLNEKKVCGVLVEGRTTGRELPLVAGVGLNVHHRPEDFPPELRHVASSVQEQTGRDVSRAEIFARLLSHLEELLELDRAGAIDLSGLYAPYDDLVGRFVEIEAAAGRQVGTARGVTTSGALLLETPTYGTVEVQSGEATARART